LSCSVNTQNKNPQIGINRILSEFTKEEGEKISTFLNENSLVLEFKKIYSVPNTNIKFIITKWIYEKSVDEDVEIFYIENPNLLKKMLHSLCK
jgi:hypothetical protein